MQVVHFGASPESARLNQIGAGERINYGDDREVRDYRDALTTADYGIFRC